MSDQSVPLKRCSKCKQYFPATVEYFPRSKDRKDGFYSWCKPCSCAATKRYVDSHPEYVERNKRRLIGWKKAHYDKEQRRIRHLQNRDKDNAQARERYRKTIEYQHERSRKARLANPDKRRAEAALSQKKHPETHRASQRNRRARKQASEGSHNAADIQAQYKHQRGKCYYCGEKLGKTYHVDHVIPLDRGGSNGPSNLVVTCPKCNLSKGSKLPHEWPEGGRLL